MFKYLVVEINTKKSWVCNNCQDAARVAQVSPEEIPVALEEWGICETDQYTIIEIFDPLNEAAVAGEITGQIQK